MALAVKVVTLDGDEISEPYLVRIAGWTEERYFREAPETWFFEFEDGEVIVHSPTSPGHQELILFLSILLQGYLRHRRLGKVLNGPAGVRGGPPTAGSSSSICCHETRALIAFTNNRGPAWSPSRSQGSGSTSLGCGKI